MVLKLPTKIPQGRFYYHYKHDPNKGIRHYAYEVVSIGFHTEDDCRKGEESFINYRPLYEEAAVYQASKQLRIQCIDNRPLEMWMEDITKDGETFPRFALITNEDIIRQLEEVSRMMYGPQ